MSKMLKILVALSVTLLALFSTVECHKILCLFPIPSKSHVILVEPLFDKLASRGHELTVVTPYPRKNVEYKQVDVSEILTRASLFDFFDMRNASMWEMLSVMNKMSWELANTSKIIHIVKSNEKFDLVFGEVVLMHGLICGFSAKLQIPLVAISPFMPNQFSFEMVGNPSPTSYIPDSMSAATSKMTFTERFLNTLGSWALTLHMNLNYYPLHDKIMRTYFGEDLPPLKQIMKNTSLVLANHHFGMAYSRPLNPNLIEVGGLHVQEPKPVPKQFKDFLDKAKEGAILFSLGSNAKSKDMGEQKIKNLIEAFGRLKYKIIWKFENENLEGKPSNVIISNWLPQSDILAHPNIKLFITHGGLLSTTEAVVRGVPIIGIPLIGDQTFNMQLAEYDGIGRILEFDNITADSVTEMIHEVIDNPKYRERVQLRSKLVQDRPMSAMDSAVFWIEYVLRHNGAYHMRSAAQDLYMFELYLWDVYLLLSVVCLITMSVFICLGRKVLRRFGVCRCKHQQESNGAAGDKKKNN